MNTNTGPHGLSLKTLLVAGFVALGLSACGQEQAEAPVAPAPGLKPLSMDKGGMDQTGPYDVVDGWFKPGIDGWDYPPTAVLVDNPDRIFVAFAGQHMTQPHSLMHTADGKVMEDRSTTSELPREEKKQLHQIVVLNGNGEIIEDWSQWNDVFGMPHTLAINPYDPERHLWVVDTGHQVFKFTNDGKEMVMHLGEKGVTGWSENRFNMPSSIAFLPDGTFLLADGYVNGRIARFDADGKYLSEFGSKGSGPGQFDLVHAITMDDQGRIYAADRRNHRIQVFDKDGTFIEEWPNLGSPTKVRVTDDQMMWVTDAQYTRFAKYDLNGHLLTYWGVKGNGLGEFDNLHSFDVDAAGNLYVGDAWNNRVQKFVPKADADPARLIGQRYVLPAH